MCEPHPSLCSNFVPQSSPDKEQATKRKEERQAHAHTGLTDQSCPSVLFVLHIKPIRIIQTHPNLLCPFLGHDSLLLTRMLFFHFCILSSPILHTCHFPIPLQNLRLFIHSASHSSLFKNLSLVGRCPLRQVLTFTLSSLFPISSLS